MTIDRAVGLSRDPSGFSGLLAFGKNLQVLSVNRSFPELFGISIQEVVGKPVDEVLAGIGFSEECRRAVVRRPFRNLECTISTAAKGAIALDLPLSRIHVAGEEWLLVVDDIAERKRAEIFRVDWTRVLEWIAAGRELGQVLEEITLVIEKPMRGAKASVLLLDPATQCLGHAAAPSLPAEPARIWDR